MMTIELYTTPRRPHSAAARDDLAWRGEPLIEYDVEQDRGAYERMLTLSGGQRTAPVIVEAGKPVQIGWQGQGCLVRHAED